MKKYYILLFFALLQLITVDCISQNNYYKLIDTNKIWNYYDCYAGPPPHYTYLYRFTSDTLIQGKNYHKIETTNDSINWQVQDFFLYEVDSTKRVYMIYNNVEGLLYDFSINVGDSITIMNPLLGTQPHTLKIDSIDSIQVDNKYIKVLFFENEPWHYWIEGIGDTYGLEYPGTDITGFCRSIVCYYENDSVKFINPLYGNCFASFLNIIENKIEKEILFHPNPFSSTTIFQANIYLKNATITIYDSYGRQVKEIKNISGQTITLQRDNLPSGLYFLQLTQNNIILTQDKLVIIDN